TLWEEGVCFRFHTDTCRPQLPKWQLPLSFHRVVADACVEAAESTVVHVHGLLYPLQLRALRSILPRNCAIVAQHHADRPWPPFLRPLQRVGLRSADGFFFSARGLAARWAEQGLIAARQPTFQIMEGSNDFRHEDRNHARSRTGISGDPVLLWVGRLIPLKDPLTVLDGV